jgi:hypothetical protein
MWKATAIVATRRDRDQFLRFAAVEKTYPYMHIFVYDPSRQFVSLRTKLDPPLCVKMHDENVGGRFCLEKPAKLRKLRLHRDSKQRGA